MSIPPGTEIFLSKDYRGWTDFTVPKGTHGIVIPNKSGTKVYTLVVLDMEFPDESKALQNSQGLLFLAHEIEEV